MSRGALAKIHIAKKELRLHDDDYRALLQRETGQTTSRGLSDAQAGRVIEAFKRLGWTPKVVPGGQDAGQAGKAAPLKSASPADSEAARKCRALWISLAQLGAIRDSSEAALEAFAKRQIGCEKLRWANQQEMYRLVEGLKAMAGRHGWSQDVGGIPPGLHILTLRRRLVAAQCARLGRVAPGNLKGMRVDELAPLSVELGRAIAANRAPDSTLWLWRGLWNLGLVMRGSEEALDACANRLLGHWPDWNDGSDVVAVNWALGKAAYRHYWPVAVPFASAKNAISLVGAQALRMRIPVPDLDGPDGHIEQTAQVLRKRIQRARLALDPILPHDENQL